MIDPDNPYVRGNPDENSHPDNGTEHKEPEVWRGYIIEVDADSFTARLEREGEALHELLFPIAELKPEDKDSVTLGAQFIATATLRPESEVPELDISFLQPEVLTDEDIAAALA